MDYTIEKLQDLFLQIRGHICGKTIKLLTGDEDVVKQCKVFVK